MKTRFFQFLTAALICGFVLGFSTSSQAQLGKKLKEKMAAKMAGNKSGESGSTKSGKGPAPYAEDFEDATGVSGAYTASVGVEVPSNYGTKTQTVLKLHFLNKEDGKVVNKLKVYVNKQGTNVDMYLDEKTMEQSNVRIFNHNRNDDRLMELEAGVLAYYDGKEKKVTDVWVKDAAQLEVYDLEVAEAKYASINRKLKTKMLEKKKNSMMTYKAYKAYAGKIAFANHYSVFNYRYSDRPSEDPAKFLKANEVAKDMYMRAYFNMPIGVECGEDCTFNIEYEMLGEKTNREQLRNSSRKWSNNIKEKTGYTDNFCWYAHTLTGDVWDYAYVYLLYKNKDKFQIGKTYKMTVRVYAHKDGNDEKVMAEGTINLEYTKNSEKYMADKMEKFQRFMDE